MAIAKILTYTPDRFDVSSTRERPKTQKELEAERLAKIEQEAFEKGYREGMEKAKLEEKALLEEGRRRIEDTCQRLNSLIERLSRYRKETVEELFPEVLNISVEIASKIIKKEVELDRNVVSYIAQECLSRVEETDASIVIKVNPADYDVIVERSKILKESSNIKNLSIEPVASIEPGGCLVETDKGEIDGRIGEQIAEMADAVSTATHRDL